MTNEQRITALEDALIAMARVLRHAQQSGYVEPGAARRSYETAAAIERLATAAEQIAESRTTTTPPE